MDISVNAADTYTNFLYETNSDGTITITKYRGNAENVTVPDQIEGKTVSAIDASVFSMNEYVKSITVPDSVLSIGEHAFSYCDNLEKVVLPNGLEKIEDDLFEGSKNLKNIDIPKSVKHIGKYSFQSTGIVSAYIPDGVKTIDEGAFNLCGNLTELYIPDSVTYIAPFAFTNNDKLLSVRLSANILKINDGTFSECKSLDNVIIPPSVRSIGMLAFYNCYSLKSVTIPPSVKEFDYDVFGENENLTIYGQPGSAAQEHAENNGYSFSKVRSLKNTSTILKYDIICGETVTVNAEAYYGMGYYTYAVLYKKKADTKWTVKQNYSTNSTITVKPAKATDYDICVKVKDSQGTIVKKFFAVKVNEKLKNNSTISATAIKKGGTVTVKGVATGGIGNYEYGVLYKNSVDKKWTVKQAYSDNANIKIKPARTGEYQICIKIKDETGKIEKKYFYVTVK